MEKLRAEKAVGQRETHEKIDAVLEHMLENGVEIGSGKDAIVFRVDLASLPKPERHLLVENGVIDPREETDAIALKILKIYDPGLGDYEFQMQKKAREILAAETGAVKVPDTTMARHQKVGDEVKNSLNARGGSIEKEVEMVIMDYIDGPDLGKMMYDFVLREMNYDESYIADLTYSQKEQLVGQELGFERPDLESAQTPEEKESAQAITFDRNEEKLLKYLKKKGFTLPLIFEKLDNAIRALNRNGIYHNDLHKQNIMIDSRGEVYIIDFGRAGSEKRKDGIADTMFSKRWRTLNQTEADEQNAIRAKEKTRIEELKKKLMAHPTKKEQINSFISDILNNGTATIEREFARSRGDDIRFEYFLIMLLIAREAGATEGKLVDAFMSTLKEKDLRPFERNKIQKYKNYLATLPN